MRVFLLEDENSHPDAIRMAHEVCAGFAPLLRATPGACQVGIAPSLTAKVSREVWGAPALGTLILHPSLLPRHRGPSAVHHAIAQGERFTGATWFWADEGLDTGPICEQEMCAIEEGDTPSRLYVERILPAAAEALRRALRSIDRGEVRMVPQPGGAATYESFYRGARLVAGGAA